VTGFFFQCVQLQVLMALVSQLDDCYEKFLFSFKRKPDGTNADN
jgi:hypothetical protein